jgi:hypothetical protein
MLSLVILAFGMLALAVMQLQAMSQGSQGRHTGDGTAIARSYLEQAMRLPWDPVLDTAEAAGTWVAPGVDWTGKPLTQMSVEKPTGGASTEHSYTIQWRVTDVPPAVVGDPVCLRDIEVMVTWTEEGSSVAKTHILGTRRFNQGASDC